MASVLCRNRDGRGACTGRSLSHRIEAAVHSALYARITPSPALTFN